MNQKRKNQNIETSGVEEKIMVEDLPENRTVSDEEDSEPNDWSRFDFRRSIIGLHFLFIIPVHRCHDSQIFDQFRQIRTYDEL
jgi:hypothetical protein